MFYRANYFKKGQLKIQQMAFMLVALMIFFGMVALVYFAITTASLEKDIAELRDKEARELVKKLAGTPEFAFTSSTDCSSCVDLDKLLLLKENGAYSDLWNLDYLMVERVYPSINDDECTRATYPDCGKITVKENSGDISTKTAFVTLARWDQDLNGFRYEIGRIHTSYVGVGE